MTFLYTFLSDINQCDGLLTFKMVVNKLQLVTVHIFGNCSYIEEEKKKLT